jgi:RNA polymerase sigma-70 factor, ECF subfamily
VPRPDRELPPQAPRAPVDGRRGAEAGADEPPPQARQARQAPPDGRTAAPDPGALTEVFTTARARLVGLAYRITGSRLDAEDIVQDAWLRAQRADWSTIERPEAWLTTVVSRLAFDHLRSATQRRETYVGPWLAEPVRAPSVDPAPSDAADPAAVAELSESLTLGFLRVLEALSPIERVVFLLAEVFGTPYRDIATVVDRPPATCRQIASRARRHVQAGRVRGDPSRDAARVARDLLVAVGHGDIDRVVSLLADDATLVSDGGPDAYAARVPVQGRARVARLLVNVARHNPRVQNELVTINGEPGMIGMLDGELFWALSIHVVDGTARSIHTIRNPDKLAALAVTTPML